MFNIVIEYNGDLKCLAEELKKEKIVSENCYDEDNDYLSFSEWVESEKISSEIKEQALIILNSSDLNEIDFEIYYTVQKFNGKYIYKFEGIHSDTEDSSQIALDGIKNTDNFVSMFIYDLCEKLKKLGLKYQLIC